MERKILVAHIPHGVNAEHFYKVTSTEDLKKLEEMRLRMFKGQVVDFAALVNNRNIRRKAIPDIVLAFRYFILMLPKEKAERCRLILHTQPSDVNGTDIAAVLQEVAPEVKAIFSETKVASYDLNLIYNIADVVVNGGTNEGFGISNLEALMAERLVIANVTGGLQDQLGFVDEEGKYLDEDVHFTKEWGSNHDGKYRMHGEWAFPVFPNNKSLQGSPPTPFIFDDRWSQEEMAQQFKAIYDMPKEERERRGKLGRKYALTHGFDVHEMARRFIVGIDKVFETWKPIDLWEVYKA